MMFRMNSNNACAASAYAEASFSCADMLNTVIMGAIIVASIIICCASVIRLSVLLAVLVILAVREAVKEQNNEMRTAAA